MVSEFKPLADDLYRERILRARRMSLDHRLMAGAELFDYASEASLAGLRALMPQATDVELLQELRRRLILSRKLEVKRT
jgi:hypothetical protein